MPPLFGLALTFRSALLAVTTPVWALWKRLAPASKLPQRGWLQVLSATVLMELMTGDVPVKAS